MTWTAAADAVMPACARTAAARPALPPIASLPIASLHLASLHLASPRTDTPRPVPAVSRRPAACRPVGRRDRPGWVRPPLLRHPAGALEQRTLPYVLPLHRHLLRRDVATLAGWPSDPGRDVLCLLTSPPRWLRSP
jgi:hypothetical protein